LGVNHTIAARLGPNKPSRTTFTIKFSKPGTYRFFCQDPCDMGQGGWAMTADRNGHGQAQDGFMAGYVTAS
jgi:plastocyanin